MPAVESSTTQSRIGRLVLIAGPSAVGKTYFINQLSRGHRPAIAASLEIRDTSAWVFTDTKRLQWREPYDIDLVVLAYDFLRPWKFGLEGFGGDTTLYPLERAADVRIVTLFATPQLLQTAIVSRRRRETLRYLLRLRFDKMRLARALCQRLEQLYRQPGALARHYREWVRFCDSHGHNDHWYLDRDRGSAGLQPVGEVAARIEDACHG